MSIGSVESVQVVPPSLENPTPMPWPPPFDQRSWCHMAICLLPLTANWGSTSASGKFRPLWPAFEQPASGDGGGPDTWTSDVGVVAFARPLVDAATIRAPPSATTDTVFLSKL